MIYLHKLLPAFFLPVGITLLLVGTGLLFRRRWLCWSGLGLLYFLSTGLVSGKIMRLIEGAGGRREVTKVEPANAIVVLSGVLQNRTDARLGEWSDAVDRFEGGVELFQAGKAPLLIFTGGHVPWRPEDRPEGEILKERAVKLGLPKDKISVTGKVGNTANEASAVKVLLESLEGREVEGKRREDIGGRMSEDRSLRAVGGKPRIILVTSAFHMRRAKMLFERRGLEVKPFPVDFQNSDRLNITILSFVPSAQGLAKSETAIREGIGILYYTFIKH